MWIEFDLTSQGEVVTLFARGCRGEQTQASPLGVDHDMEALGRFAAAVRSAAMYRRPLGAPVMAEARALYRAVFNPENEALRVRLAEAGGAPIMLRLNLHNADLQAVPWEALCKPEEALGFWASSPDVFPVRGIVTSEPWQPRAVRSALRVLAIAPNDSTSLGVLQSALQGRIDSGEIEWLEPIVGNATSVPYLFDRLRREPIPHVLHFLGHGSHENGVAVLRLADSSDGEETWLPVELFAQHLKANFRGFLRLIVLEACEGARPLAFASAGEILARAGASAVVAHIWPVRADVASVFSRQLYRSLAGADRHAGDIGIAMNEGRRAILGGFDSSAEAFSPILYLRGTESGLFDFKGRKIEPVGRRVVARREPSGLDPALERLLAKPFSLLLGDRFRDQRTAIAGFRDKLSKELVKSAAPVSPALSMGALTQRFALHRGAAKLSAEFQKAFRAGVAPAPYLETLAGIVGPGVHTTLLRLPWLELAIAEKQPQRTIYAIQPNEQGVMILRREANGEDWEELDKLPNDVDLDNEVVILRPYGGYTPEQVFARPLLTEDDYALGMSVLEDALPRDVVNAVLTKLSYRSALIMGLAIHTAHHRLLLHRIFPRGIPRGSLAIIDSEDGERSLWEKGLGLPGKDEGVAVIELSLEDLGTALESAADKDE